MAKAKTIELECPGCQENLQLDAGFAGGVCRCFDCGTLMTVPADASGERAERLVRPARPGEAAPRRPKRPASPTSPTARAPARPARPDSPGRRPASPLSAPPPAPADGTAADDADTDIYTTESGRVVRVNTRRSIPTATKRRVARLTTYAVFALVTALLLGVCLFALSVLLNPSVPDGPSRVLPVEAFTHDPRANPFTLDKPNALGLPLRERTAIVLDASAASEAWIDDATEAVQAGLTKPGGSRVELVFATSDGPRALFDDVEPLESVNRGKIAALRSRVAVAGEASLVAALGVALAGDPTHVILVTSQRIDDAQAAQLRELLDPRPDLILDAVLVDRESVLLDDLATGRMGRYTRLSSSQLASWRQDASRP